MADQRRRDQLLDRLAFEQGDELRLRHGIELIDQLLEGAVADGRTLPALGRVQLDSTVPVTRLAH
ncbi:hypothetical protein D3C76_1743410 [compost metagenome]